VYQRASVILNDIDEELAKTAVSKISEHADCIALGG
jgi:hypothetical protein